jgi:hypothetical protein
MSESDPAQYRTALYKADPELYKADLEIGALSALLLRNGKGNSTDMEVLLRHRLELFGKMRSERPTNLNYEKEYNYIYELYSDPMRWYTYCMDQSRERYEEYTSNRRRKTQLRESNGWGQSAGRIMREQVHAKYRSQLDY